MLSYAVNLNTIEHTLTAYPEQTSSKAEITSTGSCIVT